LKLIELLKAKWLFLGLDAPIFAWCAAALLVAGTIGCLVQLWWIIRKERRIHQDAMKRLDALRAKHPAMGREGLSAAAYDALAQIFNEPSPLASAWRDFDSRIVRRVIQGQDRLWASESAEGAFTDSVVIAPRLNRSFYAAVPGIVTGLGLLVTFLAILVALLDVRLVNNRVQGLELLIQGLSGKFLSSIAALLSASLFIFIEKPLLHHLDISRRRLVEKLDALMPRLSPTHLLAELQRDIAEQSIAFRSFNTSLAPMLRQSFSESMGPTLQRMIEMTEGLNQSFNRMIETTQGLNQMLQAAEARKQESITGSVEGLLRKLEESMTGAINRMSAAFAESLSGSAQTQFDGIAKSLSGTAALLEGMNAQFQATQNALDDLIRQAKNSTAEQMRLGNEQVEKLTAVLQGLMTQLNETAGSSVSHMAATLTSVVYDLSSKVTELGQQMTSTMQASTAQATGAANALIQRADDWSSRNAEQLARLLEKHQGQLDQIQDVRATLDAALRGFKDALGQQAGMGADLKQVSNQVNATVTAIAGAASTMKATQESLQRVAEQAAKQVSGLAEANGRQREVWEQIQRSVNQYQQTFSQVEKAASELLDGILQHCNQLTEQSRNGLEKVVQIADDYFANATNRLGGSVAELDEHLQTLTEIIANGNGRPHN
jgi:ABC-type transporter Mla subunit MlaD